MDSIEWKLTLNGKKVEPCWIEIAEDGDMRLDGKWGYKVKKVKIEFYQRY